mmetsp:Transcript_7258/g.10636  ORF Transcript_7258/g.10636 Transcript_7258/m.10636 type:complete len:216 (+) Transcript_7258:426-1073(+)
MLGKSSRAAKSEKPRVRETIARPKEAPARVPGSGGAGAAGRERPTARPGAQDHPRQGAEHNRRVLLQLAHCPHLPRRNAAAQREGEGRHRQQQQGPGSLRLRPHRESGCHEAELLHHQPAPSRQPHCLCFRGLSRPHRLLQGKSLGAQLPLSAGTCHRSQGGGSCQGGNCHGHRCYHLLAQLQGRRDSLLESILFGCAARQTPQHCQLRWSPMPC